MKRIIILYLLIWKTAFGMYAQHLPQALNDAMMDCNYTLAVQLLDAEIRDAGQNPAYLMQIADAYRSCGQTVKAIAVYQKVLAILPDNAKVLRQLVRLEMQLGNYDKGIAYCQEILQKDSTDAIAYRLLGNCYYSKRELQDAAMGYAKAYALNPDDFSTVDAFSTLLNEENHYEAALEMTEKYREKDTTNLRINQNNAEAYFRLERYDEAIQRYKALEAVGDHSFYTLYFHGVSHFAQKNYYAAHHYLEQARPSDPENTSLLYYLAIADARSSWKQDAEDYIEQVEELIIPSDSLMSWLYNGFVQVFPKRNPRYEEAMLKLLEINPSRYALWNALGNAMEGINKEKACLYYRRYLETIPENEKESYPNSIHVERALKFLKQKEMEVKTEEFWKGKAK